VEAKLKAAAVAASNADREGLILQLTQKAVRGGNNVASSHSAEAVRAIGTKLTALERNIAEAVSESRLCGFKSDSLAKVLELLQSQQTAVTSRVNQVLEECNRYALELCDEREGQLKAQQEAAEAARKTHMDVLARARQAQAEIEADLHTVGATPPSLFFLFFFFFKF
jgi:hypothetical protein